ncbi:MAG TPA: hypothetical protein VJT54_11805 [Verrucomicrobiae bacterium]|nr:hypothetical protein [Verrucomicrobiae bacterium]
MAHGTTRQAAIRNAENAIKFWIKPRKATVRRSWPHVNVAGPM